MQTMSEFRAAIERISSSISWWIRIGRNSAYSAAMGAATRLTLPYAINSVESSVFKSY